MMRASFTGALLFCAAVLQAQTIGAGGTMSGSGLLLLPAVAATPASQFRLHTSRVEYLRAQTGGMNVMELTTGLSSHLEAYVRLAAERSIPGRSVLAPGFGGKLILPFEVPLAGTVGLWADAHQPDGEERSPLFTARAVRTGLVVKPSGNGFQPAVVGGVAVIDGERHLLAGVAVATALDHDWQIGLEGAYGYLGKQTGVVAGTAHARVFPHVLLQMSAGAVTGAGALLPLLSLGVSVSTADIDFAPVVKTEGPEFRLPTIEEMEREEQQGDEETTGEGR